jgi:hypothetical protein
MKATGPRVGHLAGVGRYASNAWRHFCKKEFYARFGLSVAEEWRTLQPEDKELRKYVESKRLDERVRLMEEDLVRRFMATQLSDESTPCRNVVASKAGKQEDVANREKEHKNRNRVARLTNNYL